MGSAAWREGKGVQRWPLVRGLLQGGRWARGGAGVRPRGAKVVMRLQMRRNFHRLEFCEHGALGRGARPRGRVGTEKAEAVALPLGRPCPRGRPVRLRHRLGLLLLLLVMLLRLEQIGTCRLLEGCLALRLLL